MHHALPEDEAVLEHFGIDASTLLGHGGEARVYALDADRVLRVPHLGTTDASLDERRSFLDELARGGAELGVALPDVLEHLGVAGRTVVVERRLPGRSGLVALGEPDTDRAALVRRHLDVTARIAALPCPVEHFGEVWGEQAIRTSTFAEWATGRLTASLTAGGPTFAHLDPPQLTADLVDVLSEPEPSRPRPVHLDAFLGNMLAVGSEITALIDFGPMTIGGPPDLDPLVAVAYLAPEITPTADDGDRAVARAWAAEHGLADALAPAERWMAAYWTGAPDDLRLRGWCERILC